MKEIQVGKVMLTFKGEYDSTKSYTRLDSITYKGSSYVCLADTSDTPPTANWQLLADKGADGQPGKDGQPGSSGHDGVTPHIDTATGNWFVGSTDTGIKAQGPQGIQGVPGKDGRNGINGKDGTDVDLSGYAKESEILRPQVSEWSTVGVSLLDGTVQASGNPVRYRVITLGKIHRVEVTGWVTTTIVGGRFNSKVRIPRMGFENATKMSFSGGTTLSAYGDIVSFFAGEPGEINVFSGSKTLNTANFQINCHWTYKE